MINHIVLFKVRDYPAGEKAAILNEIKQLLLGLDGVIPELMHIEAGVNTLHPGANHDIALICHFRSEDDLNRYKAHPAHVRVAGRIAEVAVGRAAVDFEF